MPNEAKYVMSKTGILFPHQLFEENALIKKSKTIYLVEEWLFFNNTIFANRKLPFTEPA